MRSSSAGANARGGELLDVAFADHATPSDVR